MTAALHLERRATPTSEVPSIVIPPAPAVTNEWERRYAGSLIAVDAAAVGLAAVVATLVRFGSENSASVVGISYNLMPLLAVPIWLAVLGMSRAYEPRFLGVGSEEFRRVFNAGVRLTATVAFVSYVFKIGLARGFVGIAMPLSIVLLVTGRYGMRKVLHRRRARGECLHRVLVVGTRNEAGALTRQVRRETHAGMMVVGACVAERDAKFRTGDALPVIGGHDRIVEAISRVKADTVAVTAHSGMSQQALRQLSWDLEGTGVSLIVAPALTDVAGPRISIRPVAGLPLLHVEEPELSGGRQLLKNVFDRVASAFGLLLLAPVLLAIAVAIKLTDRGPVLFTQQRVGKAGETFSVFKFRSMCVDAEARLTELAALNEHDGVLFKVKDDPRITRVGKWLRRLSLDELPQLINVLRGDMSLVGPRPPLPSEVAQYETDVSRRLMVKPGITGLWQVSGRSDLTWEESVRLDLSYVENWSLASDLQILWKTFFAVAASKGAY